LLVPHILVSGQQKLEAFSLSGGDQFTVRKPIPSTLNGFHDGVSLKCIS
jgi:hypothetical protein